MVKKTRAQKRRLQRRRKTQRRQRGSGNRVTDFLGSAASKLRGLCTGEGCPPTDTASAVISYRPSTGPMRTPEEILNSTISELESKHATSPDLPNTGKLPSSGTATPFTGLLYLRKREQNVRAKLQRGDNTNIFDILNNIKDYIALINETFPNFMSMHTHIVEHRDNNARIVHLNTLLGQMKNSIESKLSEINTDINEINKKGNDDYKVMYHRLLGLKLPDDLYKRYVTDIVFPPPPTSTVPAPAPAPAPSRGAQHPSILSAAMGVGAGARHRESASEVSPLPAESTGVPYYRRRAHSRENSGAATP